MSDFKLVQLLNPITIALRLLGAYDNATAYNSADAVTYLGATYYCKTYTLGNLPTNTTYWGVLAEKGIDGVNDENVLRSLSSGLISGGEVTINIDTTKIDIAAGQGTIVDTITDPLNPVLYSVSWSAYTAQTPLYLNTNTFSYVGIDNTGALKYWSDEPSNTDGRIYIVLARLGHSNLTNVAAINGAYQVMMSPISQFRDMVTELGIIKQGNVISANGVNLSFDRSAGSIFGIGINYTTNPDDPNHVLFSTQSAVSFQYRTQTGVSTGTITAIDPTNYDVAGTVTAVGGIAGRSTNQRVYLFSNGNIRVQYGQTVYSNLANAIAGISTEAFTVYPNIAESAIMIGVISVRRDATDLSDTTQAAFTPTSRFGEISGGSNTASSVTLQTSYNASLTPEILTDSTRGAVTVKRGSSADTDTVFEGQNGAGTTTFSVKGTGDLSNNAITTGRNTTAPNATVPVHSISATGAEADIDSAIVPKGQGGFSLQVADGTTAGGNKRGPQSADLQMSRTNAMQVASGSQSFTAGIRNTASSSSSVAFGSTNTASGGRAVAGGFGCTASGQDSVALGNNNTASGINSFATGGGAHTNGIYGRYSHAATYLAAFGDSQWSMFSIRQSTTDANPAQLTSNAAAEAATNTVVLTNQTSFYFKGEVVAKQSGSTNAAVWKIEGFITRGANAAATTLVTSSVTAYSNAPGWTTPALAANTTLGGLRITVTGQGATNIRWFANIQTSEILYA